MKCVQVGLQNNVVGVYDQTKTTVFGRAAQKTIDSELVIGPPLTKFIDVFTDTGLTPSQMYLSDNNRLFVLTSIAAGLMTIALYDFNLATGAHVYRGVLRLTFPNVATTTHTIRGFKVVDAGVTGWKLFILTTGSVLINGGLFLANKIDLTDFTPILSNTIPFATGNDQKAMYFVQESGAVGVNHLMTLAAGLTLDFGATRAYLHNGVSATHQYFVFDWSIAPTYSQQTFTVTIATPGVVTATAHGLNNNDPFVASTTGALPTGMVAGTVYFARNVTANTFEFSATSGGASINTTGTQSGTHSFGRAYGSTTSMYVHKTGNLPALTGTLLLTNSENCCVPAHTSNAGFDCVFFPTSSALYLGRLSELTSGVTAWPSLVTSNVLGDADDITGPTTVQAFFATSIDLALYFTNTSVFVGKKLINSQIQLVFGGLSNTWLENVPLRQITTFSLVAIAAMENNQGWIMISGSTVGQRGILAMDIRSESQFDYSYLISPVVTSLDGFLNSISTLEALFDSTNSVRIQYRTSGFGSASGGWVDFEYAKLANISLPAGGIQFKVLFDITYLTVNTPAQLKDLILDYTPLNEISDHWEGSNDNTTSNTPARSAFRLKKAYPTTVPKLYFRAYDDAGTLVASANTVDNPSLFRYSTDNGTTWNNLGTIPNVINTTEIDFTWASPPGVKVSVSIRES